MELNTIQIEITDKCNYQCKHCFQEKTNSYLPYFQLIKIFEDAKNLNTKKIILTGGEPLLHPSFDKIISKIREYSYEVELYTNGHTLVDKTLKKLKQSNVNTIHLSLDGATASEHDLLRNKSGSFDRTILLINKLKKFDFKIVLTCVLNKININSFDKIIQLFESLKVKYKIDYMIKSGCAKLNEWLCISDEEYISNISKLVLAKINITKLKNRSYKKFCGIGESFVYIDSRGCVKLCPSIPSDVACYGNIYDSSIKEIWTKQYKLYSDIKCKNENACIFKNICGGGCRSRALLLNGSLKYPDTIMCQIFQNLNKEVLK